MWARKLDMVYKQKNEGMVLMDLVAFFQKAGFPGLAKATEVANSQDTDRRTEAIRIVIRPALREVQSLGDKRERWWEIPGTRSLLEIEEQKVQSVLALV